MDFRFTEDQELFARTVRDILANECPPSAVRAAWENESGTVDGLWSTLAATGVVGMTAPEDHAGLGMSDVDLVRIMEELGWAACPEVVLEHTAVALPLLAETGTAAQRDRWLTPAAAGDVRLSCSLGSALVNGAAQADALILRSGDDLHLVPTSDVTLTAQASVDETRRLAVVDWSPSADTRLDADAAAIERAGQRAAVAAAAQCVGIAQRLLDFTVEYVQERRQFGSPVGVNQAVKHHLADVGKAKERRGSQRQQRRGSKRQRLGEPPERHCEREAGGEPGSFRQSQRRRESCGREQKNKSGDKRGVLCGHHGATSSNPCGMFSV